MSGEYIVPVGRDGIYVVETGKWRTQTPFLDRSVCVACGQCRLFCPVGAPRRVDKSMEIDLTYCKGCGICAEECRVGAITMRGEET